jgi:tetratricopeptide (TPR) repeat protein
MDFMAPCGRPLALAVAALALACAHRPAYDFTPESMRREVARRIVDIDPADVIVPFEVGEPALAHARELLDGVAVGEERVEALVSSLSDPAGFGLRYEWAASGTAAETLERGAGNCLALSSTLVGIARGLGLKAWYLEVIVADPHWRSEGDLVVQADHVAAVIDSGEQRLYVDFSGRLTRARRVRPIDDFEVLAHYYNNRGYETLHRAEREGAELDWPAIERDFELATRVHPAHARAWNNLGVARVRQGDDTGARLAYEKAIEAQPDTQSAHLNLVALFLRAGDLERAARHLDLARRLEPRNPQIERLADSLSQSAANGWAASER